MKITKTYSELLKDPRWQRKILEVFQRDNFCCLMCGSNEHTLHVHHEKYCKNPWDVSEDHLKTLCFRCHEVAEVCKKNKIVYTNVNKKINELGVHTYFVSFFFRNKQRIAVIHNLSGFFVIQDTVFCEETLLLMFNTI